MTVDRSMFATSLTEIPNWLCPTCGKGHLEVQERQILNQETGPSLLAQENDAWDITWTEKRFAGILKCTSRNCHELVALIGSQITSEEPDDTYYSARNIFVEYYQIKSLHPAPLVIRPPLATPDLVRSSLREASGLIWQSAEGAANQVRQAVEHLMDHMGVTPSRPGAYLSLHHRIKEFERTDPINAEILLAVKWLGNSGSHAGGLTRDDVFDAFDMVELALTNLFDTSKAAIMEKVKAVNTQKGRVTPTEEDIPF